MSKVGSVETVFVVHRESSRDLYMDSPGSPRPDYPSSEWTPHPRLVPSLYLVIETWSVESSRKR